MSIKESRRPTFEQAVIDRMKEGGFLEVEIRVECLARSGDGYYDGSVDAYWHFWNTALDGVVMELPLAWKPQGEANFYAITENGNWLAIVQLNGELLREAQEEWMRLFTGQNMRITEAKAPSVTDEQAAFEAAVAAVNERGWSTSTDLARQIWNAARLNATPVQQDQAFCEYCGGNDEEPQDHCMDCTRPVQQVSVPDDEAVMAKARELFGWAYGLGGFSDAVRDLVAFAHPAAPAADAGDIVLNASAQEILSQCIGAHAYVLGVLANGRPDLAFIEAKKWVDAFKKAATQMEPSHD